MDIDFTIQSEPQQLETLKASTPWRDISRMIDIRIQIAHAEFRVVDPNNAPEIARLQERIHVYLELRELPDYLLEQLTIDDIKESENG